MTMPACPGRGVEQRLASPGADSEPVTQRDAGRVVGAAEHAALGHRPEHRRRSSGGAARRAPRWAPAAPPARRRRRPGASRAARPPSCPSRPRPGAGGASDGCAPGRLPISLADLALPVRELERELGVEPVAQPTLLARRAAPPPCQRVACRRWASTVWRTNASSKRSRSRARLPVARRRRAGGSPGSPRRTASASARADVVGHRVGDLVERASASSTSPCIVFEVTLARRRVDRDPTRELVRRAYSSRSDPTPRISQVGWVSWRRCGKTLTLPLNSAIVPGWSCLLARAAGRT